MEVGCNWNRQRECERDMGQDQEMSDHWQLVGCEEFGFPLVKREDFGGFRTQGSDDLIVF